MRNNAMYTASIDDIIHGCKYKYSGIGNILKAMINGLSIINPNNDKPIIKYISFLFLCLNFITNESHLNIWIEYDKIGTNTTMPTIVMHIPLIWKGSMSIR